MMNDYGGKESPFGDTTGYGGYDNSYLMENIGGGMGMNDMYENPYSPSGFPGTTAQKSPQRNLKKVQSEKNQQKDDKKDKKKKKGAGSGGSITDSRNGLRASEIL